MHQPAQHAGDGHAALDAFRSSRPPSRTASAARWSWFRKAPRRPPAWPAGSCATPTALSWPLTSWSSDATSPTAKPTRSDARANSTCRFLSRYQALTLTTRNAPACQAPHKRVEQPVHRGRIEHHRPEIRDLGPRPSAPRRRCESPPASASRSWPPRSRSR